VSTRFQLGGYQGQQVWRSLAAGLAAAACGLFLILLPVGTTFERTFGLDWLFKLRGARTPPPYVAVVGINSGTGRALGLPRLPHDWPRTVHARLIDRLVSQNAEGIVFDIDFSRSKPGDEDAVLANAISKADRVVLFEWLSGRRERVITANGGDGGWIWVEQMQPLPKVLADAAKALGPFPLPKLDQAAFEFWTFKSSAGDAPTTAAVALQLKALAAYDEWLSILKEAHAQGVKALPAHAGDLKGPPDILRLMQTLRRMFQQDASLEQSVRRALDRQSGEQRSVAASRKLLEALAALYAGPDHYYINFYGPPGTVPTIAYDSLLKENAGDAPAQNAGLTNAMVFVGYSDLYDPDQPDRFYTSFTGKDGVDLSGVEIMATAYANLLSQRTLVPSPLMRSALAVVAFGLIVGTLAYLLPATLAVPAVFALAALYAGVLQWRFNEADLWLPLATPLLVQVPLALLIGLLGQYLLKRRKEEQMTRAIRYYLPDTIVKDLAQRQVDPTTLNRVVFGTCLATDMSDFISLAESKSPHELAIFMNEYFDALAQALKRHGVDVMEFRADMIMCAWITSTRSAAICRKGMEAAIEVSEIITRFAQQHGSRHFTPRVGLQDGDIYVGHTGGGGRFLYSIVGDTANIAARLESLNKHLGTHVLAAESVVQDANGLLLRPLGAFRLRGKADPTSIFEILGRHDGARAEHLDLCVRFAEGLAAFQRKEWQRAAILFEAISKLYVEDGPSRFYWAHSQRYAEEAPAFEEAAVIQMSEK
jgi:adenylate cyclase